MSFILQLYDELLPKVSIFKLINESGSLPERINAKISLNYFRKKRKVIRCKLFLFTYKYHYHVSMQIRLPCYMQSLYFLLFIQVMR